MGKSKSLELPKTPEFQRDPTAATGIPDLLKYGQELASGDFGGRLSWLNPTINNNNSALALAGAQGILQPQFRDTLQQITNSAAANGQLNSSTFTDALARSQSDLNSQYQSIVSQQAINDSNQSNANRLSLLGTGLNTIQGASGLGLQAQGQENQFNLENYNNQVAAILANKGSGSNIFGGLGTALGAGAGFLVGGPVGAGVGATIGGGLGGTIDASQGGTGSAGFAGMGGGLGLLGGAMQSQDLSALLRSGYSAPAAGAFASNSIGNYGLKSSPYYSNAFGNGLLN